MGEKNSSAGADSTNRKQRKPRGRRLRRKILCGVALVLLLAIGTAVFLIRSEPAHWRNQREFLSRTTPQQRDALAANVHGRLTDLITTEQDTAASPVNAAGTFVARIDLTSLKVDKTQTIFMSNDEMRAFFTAQFNEWMTDKGYVMPKEVKQPMIQLEDGSLVMAFMVQAEGYSQVLSARFSLVFDEKEMARMKLSSFLAGQLPVPSDQIASYLASSNPGNETVARVGNWLSKLDDLKLDPVIKTNHRRRARVRGYKITPQGIELTLRVMDHQTWRGERERFAAVSTQE